MNPSKVFVLILWHVGTEAQGLCVGSGSRMCGHSVASSEKTEIVSNEML